ncbi:MAG TPA: LON peptidase substrate-binding domain-containing protein [Nevskiaceae bacterium]|nr:LON peptidase substrate-binding domain-containing protein [Nevskiaceae bacterium]
MADSPNDTESAAQFRDDAAVEIPIFPLNTVLYPQGLLPLRIFEVRYVDMTKACIRDESVFGVCHIVEGREAGAPAVPAPIGCTARIEHWDVPHAGLFSLLTRGERVFRIREHWVAAAGLVRAKVTFEPVPPEVPLPGSAQPLAKFLAEMFERAGGDRFPKPWRLDDTAWVCHRFAELLPLSREEKLRLLETQDPLAKLDQVERAIATMAA